jgi:hypothetical protein
MVESGEYCETPLAKYQALRLSLRQLIDNTPDFPPDLKFLLEGLLAEEFFDTPLIKMELLNYSEEWSQNLQTIILSLECNEAFTDAARRFMPNPWLRSPNS